MTFVDGIEFRREALWAWGAVAVAVGLGWAVVTGRRTPKAVTRRRLMTSALTAIAFGAWIFLLSNTLYGGLADRTDMQLELIILAEVVACGHLIIMLVGVANPRALSSIARVGPAAKSVILDSVSPLLITSSAFVLTVLAAETWEALQEVPWRTILVIWLACAASSVALASRESTSGAGPGRGPLRRVGLLITIAFAAMLVFVSLGGGLVQRTTAEVWMGLRSTDPSDAQTCRLPLDCDEDWSEDGQTAYISVLAKIAVLLSGMAMVGATGAIRDKDPERSGTPTTIASA
jgi:hypothetical protein